MNQQCNLAKYRALCLRSASGFTLIKPRGSDALSFEAMRAAAGWDAAVIQGGAPFGVSAHIDLVEFGVRVDDTQEAAA